MSVSHTLCGHCAELETKIKCVCGCIELLEFSPHFISDIIADSVYTNERLSIFLFCKTLKAECNKLYLKIKIT